MDYTYIELIYKHNLFVLTLDHFFYQYENVREYTILNIVIIYLVVYYK